MATPMVMRAYTNTVRTSFSETEVKRIDPQKENLISHLSRADNIVESKESNADDYSPISGLLCEQRL